MVLFELSIITVKALEGDRAVSDIAGREDRATKKIRLRLLTPDRVVFDGDTDYVVLRTTEGELGVLPGHEPYCAMLSYSVLRAFKGKNQEATFALLGGFATIADNVVTVLSPVAEHPEKMDQLLAEKQKARDDNKHSEKVANLEIQRAENALRHMLVNMDVSTYSILNEREEI